MRGFIVAAGTVVVLAVLPLLPAGGSSVSATAPLRVSDVSPFEAGCGLAADGGTLFPNSEVEPWVDVSPANPDVVVAMWQQDRWSNGGARGNVIGASTDGGSSWQVVAPPGVSDCTDGPFDRASDPWVSFSPNGDLHLMHLVLDIEAPPGQPGGFGRNGMMVQKVPAGAFDDGTVAPSDFTEPILIAEDSRGDLHDKNSMTADPHDSDFVYAVWDLLDLPQGATINPDRGVFGGGLGFKGAALFARTTDGGQTWSQPEVLYDPGGVNQTIGNQVVVLPDGTLINFFNEILNFRNDDGGNQFDFNLAFKRSPDRGQTWLPRGRPVRFAELVEAPVVDPDTGESHRTAEVLFDVAVDRDSGALYAVWQDRRFTGVSAVAFVASYDGGSTWSTPIRVNRTPDVVAGTLDGQAFLPSVHVADDGSVGVSYYDFRSNAGTDDSETLTDHWIVHCHGDCATRASWNDEVHVTGPFDARQAPFARGYFLGDYVGLANQGDAFASLLIEGVSGSNPTDAVYSRIHPSP